LKKIGFKTILTKSLAALLVALMFVPSLASCSEEQDIQDTIIPVYTFYGIKGEGTTDEAIRAVELAINRILISRYTLAVDLRLFSEAEYEEALMSAMEDVEKYEKGEYSSEESLESGDDDPYTYTEDKIISMLENGKDFKLKAPRVDVVLCKDSKHYFDLANSKKLVAIDTTLENEGKVLSEYIHPTLFSLAKIGRKTYGVPNNVALGEYEYIVFNKEYLEKHKYDYTTMKTLEDLEDYLELIKTEDKDVVPLLKAGTPATYEYLFGDNSPFYINPATTTSGEATGRLYGTFDTSLFAYIIEDYATLIGKYNSLGYLPKDGDSGKDFAVTFIKGTPADIKALEEKTGKKFEYAVYKNPVATTESLGTVYSISSSVSDTEVTTIIDIIVAMFTDEKIKNYFYHGVQGEHYILDDDERVQPIKNESTGNFDYVMSNEYTGNVYLAALKQGENESTNDYIKQINLAAKLSLTSGFSYVPKTYTVGDKTLTEPNYVEIMQEAFGDAVHKLSTGAYGFIDYDEFKVTIEADLKAYAEKIISAEYAQKLVDKHLEKNDEYLKSKEFLDQVRKEATDLVNEGMITNAKTALKNEFTKVVKEEMPDATAEEIDAAVASRITDEAIEDYISKNFSQEEKETLISNRMNILINNVSASISKDYKESAEYKNAVAKYTTSSEYASAVAEYIATKGNDYVEKEFIMAIENQIIAETESLQEKAVEAVELAIKNFNKEASKAFDWTPAEASKNLDVNSYSDFFEKRVEAQYYVVYTDPDAKK